MTTPVSPSPNPADRLTAGDLDKAVERLTAWLAWFDGGAVGRPESIPTADMLRTLLTALSAKDAELAKAREALTPSGDTKAAYHGEFKMPVTFVHYDDDGEPEEATANVMVPWTTVKEIMAAIAARAGVAP